MKLEQRFPEKRAFITGAASGLGLAICEYLAARDWRLFIADINSERLQQVKDRFDAQGVETHTLTLDVSKESALNHAVSTVEKQWSGIDLVFNNAGIASAGKMETVPLEEWNRVIDIDLWSVIYGCRAFIPILKDQRSGYIINTASSAGTLAGAEMASYNVAKAGVVSLSETLKVELSDHNIGVTVICPTIFRTQLGESIIDSDGMSGKLKRQLNETKVTSEDIVKDLFSKIDKNRLYVITQKDALWGWRFKRFFPELWLKLCCHFYARKKWIFSN